MLEYFKLIKKYFFEFLKQVSAFLDNILKNDKYLSILSFLLAIGITVLMALGDGVGSIIDLPNQSGTVIAGLPVNVSINNNEYEVSGLPQAVDAYVVGDLTTIQSVSANRNIQVGVDLNELQEGTHNVRLVAIGGANTRISLTPSNATVTIRRKTRRSYSFSYDLINRSTADLLYGEAKFDVNQVVLRASEFTLNKIKTVKAIIDVREQIENITTTAQIVAYDENGDKVDVTTEPESLNVTVAISQPEKEVPITVQVDSTYSNPNLAIDGIEIVDRTVKVYGNSDILKNITEVVVTIPLSQFDQDSKLLLPLTPISGVTFSLESVNVSVSLAEKKSKTISGLTAMILNNTSYKVEFEEPVTIGDLTVYGTQKQLDLLTNDSIKIYPDLTNITEGSHEVNLIYDLPNTITFDQPNVKAKIIVRK